MRWLYRDLDCLIRWFVRNLIGTTQLSVTTVNALDLDVMRNPG